MGYHKKKVKKIKKSKNEYFVLLETDGTVGVVYNTEQEAIDDMIDEGRVIVKVKEVKRYKVVQEQFKLVEIN